MPIDYKKYPITWKQLREKVLERAENKCEFCQVENYAVGVRSADGTFKPVETLLEMENLFEGRDKVIQIVLTIAHLDHDEENHDININRLAALCQRCHLIYDIEEKKNRRHNKKAVADLFQPLKKELK